MNKVFRARKHTLNFIGQADQRTAYKDRRTALSQLPSHFSDSIFACVGECDGYTVPLSECMRGSLNGCKMHSLGLTEYSAILKNSKFGLMLRGDNPTSGRLYDFIAAGVIPVIISDPACRFEDNSMPFS